MNLSSLSLLSYSADSFSARRNTQLLGNLTATGTDLQRQLATGLVSDTFSGLGDRRLESLNLHSRLSQIDGWKAAATDANLRLSLLDQTMTQLETTSRDVKKETATSQFQLLPDGRTQAQSHASEALRQAVELLNQEINGRYLLSGRTSDTQPVLDADTILNGTATQAGLKALVTERKAADLGTGGLGRLTVTGSGTGTTLTEEAAGLPFGMKLAGGQATGSAITVTGPTGSPAAVSVALSGQPADGDTITLGLTMPDGTTETITLKMQATADPLNPTKGVLIGATLADTATNITTAITQQLQKTALTTLASASAVKAANAFFAGSPSSPPQRVPSPAATATTLTAGTAADTVIWYKGDDTAADPRKTASVQVDGGTPIGIGVQANEQAFRSMMANLSILASETFLPTDTNASDRYAALTTRVASGLNPNIGTQQRLEDIHAELGFAQAAVKNATDRNTASRRILDDARAGIEEADMQTVATQLSSLQTRLQASYQTTSMLSKLTLTNFLR